MKLIKYLPLIAAVVLLPAFTFSNISSWEIVKDYSIKFSGDRVSGEFKEFNGVIYFDADKPDSAKFNLRIDVRSINTNNSLMDKHAIGEDWFDADKYPQITFVSSNFFKSPAGFQVTGNLTMHNVAKEITIPFNFVKNVFTSKFEIARGDYNVGDTTGLQGWVAKTLQIEVTVPVKKKSS
jgi:polyisoprenoid-binding protein YceI